jgi:hypothetical protein
MAILATIINTKKGQHISVQDMGFTVNVMLTLIVVAVDLVF